MSDLTREQILAATRKVIRHAIDEWVQNSYLRDLQRLEPVATEEDLDAISELALSPMTWIGFDEEDDGDECDWLCPHSPTGTFGWPEQIDMSQTHMSLAVCDLPACRMHANARVLQATGHEGVYRPFTKPVKETAS